jgi:hypothetical protein
MVKGSIFNAPDGRSFRLFSSTFQRGKSRGTVQIKLPFSSVCNTVGTDDKIKQIGKFEMVIDDYD